MFRKTVFTLIAVCSLFAVAAVVVHGSSAPYATTPKDDFGYGFHMPRHVKGKVLKDCLVDLVECGLVVW